MEWQEEIIEGVLYYTYGMYAIRKNKNSFSIYHKDTFSMKVFDIETAKKICEIALTSTENWNNRKHSKMDKIKIIPDRKYITKIESKSKEHVTDKKAQELASMQFENDLMRFNTVEAYNE